MAIDTKTITTDPDSFQKQVQPKLTTKRCGECNNCGWCCQFLSVMRIVMPDKDINADSERFYLLRNGSKGPDGKIRVVSHQFSPCMEHDGVNKKCNIYDERPAVCAKFPSTPDQIEGTPCSHWFELLNDSGEVVERRGGLDSPYPTPPRFYETRKEK